jgi:hypothetical protein
VVTPVGSESVPRHHDGEARGDGRATMFICQWE